MHNTLLSLDPVRDAELWTAVNAKLASLRQADGTNATPWAQLQVEAFIATVATGDAVARVPQVGVLIDYQTIRDGLHAHSICELDIHTRCCADRSTRRGSSRRFDRCRCLLVAAGSPTGAVR